jgi:hypothetical protein
MGMSGPTDSYRVLESCHSTWVFDEAQHRFHRVLRDQPSDAGVATPWQDYYALMLETDSEAFTVWLNEDGTRRLRSWRHRDRCEACDTEATVELDLSAIAEHHED